MKKKAIEKIPYLKLPKVSRKKDVKYIAVTAFKNIAHERHLFVEVYENSKNTKDIPVVRIVLTKKDFGNYFPKTGKWTHQRIEPDHNYNSQWLIWYGEGINEQQTLKENILQGAEDFDRIKKVCDVKIWQAENWWEYIYAHEDNIVCDERIRLEKRRYERRETALKDREENTPELPEQSILDEADRLYFQEKHFLYYKKHGCWADVACSKCGGVAHGRWKAGISYESEFQKWIEEPREGLRGTCPLCGANGRYKCQGKVKGEHSQSIHLFLGQKYKEIGLVMRYIEVSKTWILDLICGEKGLEMSGALEKISDVEIARAYFLPGKKVQIDYNKYNPYTGRDFWDDCNLNGMANIQIKNGTILAETYENMDGTMFQYSAIKEYARTTHELNPIDYLKRYQQIPQMEMLVKMGLTEVASGLIKGTYGIVENENAKRPDDFLGIRKCRVRHLINKHGDLNILEAMKTEYQMGACWKDEQLEHIAEAHLQRRQIEVATTYMSLQQLLNRIKKYAKCEWGTECRREKDRLQRTATTYMDYLYMRLALGYDLNNTVYQQPRNLEEAHMKMVKESNEKEAEKRLNEVKIKFPNIRKQYRKLRNRYFYEDKKWIIRPARSAEEIVIEGRVLNHCVKEDNYLRKHDNGETYILMLRQQNEPETPYITVEIGAKSNRIIQWHGRENVQPDKENMEKWLDEYVKKLKAGELKTTEPQEKEMLQMRVAV